MKKQDFIRTLSEKVGLSQDVISKVLAWEIELITEVLKTWEEVNITGFGAFRVLQRAPRNGVNPRTGESIKIPAMNSPVFKAWKTLKDAVR